MPIDTGRFSKLPYLGMKLGHWPKLLHIYCGVRVCCVCSTRPRFCAVMSTWCTLLSRLCVGRGALRPSVCLGGLLARRLLSVPTLIASASVLSGLSQWAADMHPTVFLTPEPSTVVTCFGSAAGQWFRGSAAGQWFCGRLIGHVYRSVYSFPGSLQQRPHVSISAGPFRAARNHNPTSTVIIFVCVDSFIRVLTAKHRMPNLSPVTPSCAHVSHFTVLVTASAARYSGWLLEQERLSNPGGLR